MAVINDDISADDVITRNLDVYELMINNWGNADAGSADATSRQFPATGAFALPACYGIAIGPRSTVDRCYIQYDLMKIIQSTEGNPLWSYLRPVTVGAPLLFVNQANRAVASSALSGVGLASLIVRANQGSTIPNSTTTPTVGGYAGWVPGFSWGPNYTKVNGETESLITPINEDDLTPMLHLYFYLRPPILSPPLVREPFQFNLDNFFTGLGEQNQEAVQLNLPVSGRRRVTMTLRASLNDNTPGLNNGTPVDMVFRFAGLSFDRLSATVRPIEKTLGTMMVTAANGGIGTVEMPLDGATDFLIVYSNPPGVQPIPPVAYRTHFIGRAVD